MSQQASQSALERRRFLRLGAMAAGGLFAFTQPGIGDGEKPEGNLHLATNQYPWLTFYRRAGIDFGASLDKVLGQVVAAGMDGYEPLASSPQQVEDLAGRLKKHGLQMRSVYVNSTLHDAAAAEKSIGEVVAIAEKAKTAGTRIIVTNPNPIRWGGEEDKTDPQLRTQAEALNRLGERLAGLGMVLAYHNHDAELRNAARELHHMLVGTEPKLVTLCLDAHWIYRGAGNSAVAVMDVVKLYGPRITELHLRQSVDGTWTEAFGEGDIDYAAIVQHLVEIGVRPHVVLEQAVEKESPKTMNAEQAHRRGGQYARRVFAPLAD